jgi:cytochrome b subunit of formate dehydrogenase
MTRTAGSAGRTGAAMRQPDTLPRFTPVERFAHRATALLVLVLIASGLSLFYPPLALLVGRRPLVESVHVVAGLLLPMPTVVALLSRDFRADLARLDRFAPDDWEWLRRRDRRRASLAVDKFNAGQKLAAASFGAAGVVLFGTGLLLLFPDQLSLPDGVRQGATVVHDATTLAVVALLLGHAWLALRHPESRAAMRTGAMDAAYARREYAAWAARASEPRGPSSRA